MPPHSNDHLTATPEAPLRDPGDRPPASAAALTAPVVDTTTSPHARLHPVGIAEVNLTDGFWQPRLDRNREVTIPAQYAECEATGALRNFQRAAGTAGGGFNGRYYSDSDVYKWVEAASWTLAGTPSAQLSACLDEVINLVGAAQREDGYLNTYFAADLADDRWTDLVLRHEMYCIGHLVQAAIAHHRATGARSLLDLAVRACTHIYNRYTPGRVPGTCGHPCLEMALVELYRTTGQKRWLDLASWQLDSRGRGVLDGSEYLLDHRPVREQTTATGHAVRALYLYAAITDVILETGDTDLRDTIDRLWADISRHKTSITGGIGARWDGEAFGDAYELPDRAYNETCAAIGHIFLAWRLLLLTGDAQYRDAIETALYNGVLPGLSLDGTRFFYQNPLADAGRHRRAEWFSCACCPPNIARLLASLPGYLYTTSGKGLWVQLYIGNRSTLRLADGTAVTLAMDSGLPWQGDVGLTLDPDQPTDFTLYLPVPGWCEGQVSVRINGTPADLGAVDDPAGDGRAGTGTGASYLALRRVWQPGDTVEVSLSMPVRPLRTHPRAAATHHRVAVTRGPVVYCMEQADHPGTDVADIRLRGTEDWAVIYQADLLGGVVTLTSSADAVPADDGPLHRQLTCKEPPLMPVEVIAVPYFAWANREPGAMRVFIPLAE